MIEYASSYGNDWFVVPLTLPVGSLTRVDSLVVTDTFGVRSLAATDRRPRAAAGALVDVPAGDPARAPARGREPHQSASSCRRRSAAPRRVRHSRTCCSCATRWPTWPGPSNAGSRARSSSPRTRVRRGRAQRRRHAGRRRADACRATCCRRRYRGTGFRCCRCIRTRCSRTAWTDRWRDCSAARAAAGRLAARSLGAQGDVLNRHRDLLLFDEEVPREGVRVARQRQAGALDRRLDLGVDGVRKPVGRGEGSSGLRFDNLERE